MKNICLIFILILIISCTDNRCVFVSKDVVERDSISNKFMDSIGCSNLVIESKWKFYLKYCDKKIIKDGSGKLFEKLSFVGEANLYLFSASIHSDTLVNFLFDVILDDTVHINRSFQLEDTTMKYKYYTWHYCNLINKDFYGYGYDQIIKVDSLELNDYCNGVPNCNKKEFIETNRDILNPWFIQEAIRRKFITK